jgi:hypothetical protein
MKKSIWGPAIWKLLHVLAHKLKDDSFPTAGKQLFYYIIRICNNLPCPDCAKHATAFLNKLNPSLLKSKGDLIQTLHIFHNSVNKRTDKPLQPESILSQYENENIIHVFNNFIAVFNTHNNKLLADNLQRKFILRDFKRWFLSNIQCFRQ